MPLCPPFNNSVPNSPEESASRERQRHTLPNFFRSSSAPVSPRNSAEQRQPRFQRRGRPIVGIRALTGSSRNSSRETLSWDNLETDPTFLNREQSPFPLARVNLVPREPTPLKLSILGFLH